MLSPPLPLPLPCPFVLRPCTHVNIFVFLLAPNPVTRFYLLHAPHLLKAVMPRRRGGGGRSRRSSSSSSGGGGMFGGLFGGGKGRKAPSAPRGTRSASGIPRRNRSVPAPRPAAPPAGRSSSGGGGMMPGLGATVAQGMAFGTGSAIAHRAVGAVANGISGGGGGAPADDVAASGAPAASHASPDAPACGIETDKFYECLDKHGGAIGECQWLFDAMMQCNKDASAKARTFA